MKIIISPAKVQNGKTIKDYGTRKPYFNKETTYLNELLKDHSKEGLGKLMKIKGKLLDETYENLHNSEKETPAIVLYNGIVFKEIDVDSYDQMQLAYLDNHLRILSAYYGVLEPFTSIFPYRLDMTMKPEKHNLYVYWDKAVHQVFSEDETIINLASNEFSKMIKHPMVNIHFKEEQSDGSLKVVTVRAKKARGLMVNYMISNMIDSLDGIKEFDEMGYIYDESLSNEDNLTFVLPYES